MPETILTKRCSGCKEIKEVSNFARNRAAFDGYQHYCRPCDHASTKRHRKTEAAKISWRKRGAKWQAKNKHKHATHEAFQRALKSGMIIRPNFCQECKKECKPEAHHHKGYSVEFRLDVQWLCRSCHANIK